MGRKKIFGIVALAIGLIVVIGAAASAQVMCRQGGFRGRGGFGMMGMIAQRLHLTDAQKAQAKVILQDAKKDAEAVLTPAQRDQIKQMREQHMKAMGITPEQAEKIKAIHQDARARIEKIQADTQLSDQQKREQIKAIRQDVRKQMEQIIPQAQRQQGRKQFGRQQGRQRPFQQLNLTADQKAQLKTIGTNAIAKFRQTLTPQQQAQLDQMTKKWQRFAGQGRTHRQMTQPVR
jgi:Spy/CpxP family protein refolding chaperone